MKSKAKSGSKVLWGLLYAGTFAAAFVLSAIFKMTYDPLRTRVKWNDEEIGRASCRERVFRAV